MRKDDEIIDYDELARLADEHKPKMIIAGASAYPRIIDFRRFREVADASERFSWSTWRIFPGLSRRGCIRIPASTPTSSPPRLIRRFAGRAPA